MGGIYNKHDSTALIEGTVPTVMMLFAITLRFVARRMARITFGLDDLFAVVAVLCQFGMLALMVWLSKKGAYLYQLDQLPFEYRKNNLIAIYVSSFLATGIEASSKLSILFLYRRIFAVDRTFKIWIWTLIITTVIWYILCVGGSIARCIPIPAMWEPELYPDAMCLNFAAAFASVEAINAATELIMIGLAIYMVQSLKLPRRQKIMLSLIFAIGLLNITVVIVRIVETYNPVMTLQSLFDNGSWVAVQSVTAVWLSCLPTYRPLLPRNLGVLNVRVLTSRITSWRRDPAPLEGINGQPWRECRRNTIGVAGQSLGERANAARVLVSEKSQISCTYEERDLDSIEDYGIHDDDNDENHHEPEADNGNEIYTLNKSTQGTEADVKGADDMV